MYGLGVWVNILHSAGSSHTRRHQHGAIEIGFIIIFIIIIIIIFFF